MQSFKEFLESQEETLRVTKSRRQTEKEEWVRSLEGLISQMEGWLKEFDPKGMLTVTREQREVREGAYGSYEVPVLLIRLDVQTAKISPKARKVLGPRWKPVEGEWSGWVELEGDLAGFDLFRFSPVDGNASWFIRDRVNYNFKQFNKDSFDAALVEAFS